MIHFLITFSVVPKIYSENLDEDSSTNLDEKNCMVRVKELEWEKRWNRKCGLESKQKTWNRESKREEEL